MSTFTILKILIIISFVCGIGFSLLYYFMLQVDKSPSITGGGYDKKMKEKIESKSIPTKESTVKDKMYLLESIGNDTITTKTLQERLPDREWKILATDLNLLMEKGFVTAIVGNSKLIETTYTASTKGKELLGGK